MTQDTTQRQYLSWKEHLELKQVLKTMQTTIKCGLCYNIVKYTKEDEHGQELPWCKDCNVYFLPCWTLDENYGCFTVTFKPKTAIEKIKDVNIISTQPEKKKNNKPVQTQDISITRDDPIPNTIQHQNSQENKKKTPIHKNVAGQILKILEENNRHFKTRELVENIQASRQSIMKNLKELTKEGKIRKIKRGTYAIKKIKNDHEVE